MKVYPLLATQARRLQTAKQVDIGVGAKSRAE